MPLRDLLRKVGIGLVPAPVPGEPAGPVNIYDLVESDLRDREAVGIETYGSPLTSATAIDPITYAYEECLDMALYLRKYLHARDGR
jgi:hypothetical protein